MTDINRRTVLKGAAWSIPVIAVAVATPLAAASTATCAGLRFIGTPKHAAKVIKFKVQNQSDCGDVARNVNVIVSWDGGSQVYPLGDISLHGHAETEHTRIDDLHQGVYSLTIQSDNVSGETVAVILGKP